MENLIENGYRESELELNFANDDKTEFVQFEINRVKRQVTCTYSEAWLKRRLEMLLDNIYKKTDQVALQPIFMPSVLRKPKNAKTSEEESNCEDQLNFLSEQLGKELDPNCFLIFLFIEGGTPSNQDEFEQEHQFYEKRKKAQSHKLRNRGFSEENDLVILCHSPERMLGIGRKRKLMVLFAEHLELKRFYMIDDNIGSFTEYNPYTNRAYEETSAHIALSFLENVLD